MLARRDALSAAAIQQRSARIRDQLVALPGLRGAACVMLYASYASEVRTQDLVGWALEQGKDVVLPRVRREPKGLLLYKVTAPKEQLQPGPRGIPEPMPQCCERADIEEIGFVVAPGVAFDERGVRLGQGGGYYDRFLARLRRRCHHPPVAGAAFELQIVERVPAEPHDARVDMIVTDERVLHVEDADADRPTSD
jgi:5-formyltetrahydrofolate cyclo-ligase